MEFRFEKILIPVDFTITTEVAINKALKLVDGPGNHICLLHVTKARWLTLPWLHKNSTSDEHNHVQQLLRYWKDYIEKRSPEVEVSFSTIEGSDIEKQVSIEADRLKASLVVLGRQPRQSWLQVADNIIASRLSLHTHIPVLTVMPAALNQETRTVVLPVEFSMSAKKLELMQALSRKFRMHIHLVTLIDSDRASTDALATSFLETFGWLKQHLRCQVEYHFLKGPDKTKALVKYCQQVNADLLLVYPSNVEQHNRNARPISDLFPSNSKTQILNV